jgi:hypothetical protein
MADENRSWGYDRIVGALANLGHEISDQTVGNVLRRHGIMPAFQVLDDLYASDWEARKPKSFRVKCFKLETSSIRVASETFRE